MATATRSQTSPLSSQEAEQDRLNKLLGGKLLIKFEPEGFNTEEKHHPGGNPSRGHLWTVSKAWLVDECDDPVLFWLDDRKGPVADLLAAKLRSDARSFNRLASTVAKGGAN
jgi:hypothetical protein